MPPVTLLKKKSSLDPLAAEIAKLEEEDSDEDELLGLQEQPLLGAKPLTDLKK